MDYKKLGFGLGLFSVALGASELIGARKIARELDAPGGKNLVRAYGLREMLAGAGILAAPAHAVGIWGRVAGDALDAATLGLAARRSPRNRSVWSALAFVAAATALDVAVARGLDRTTGKTFPRRGVPV